MAQIIKQRVSVKLGRSIIGPVLPKLAVNGTRESHRLEGKKVHITCVCYGCETNLDQDVFCYHGGPTKCFSCSATLGTRIESGIFETTVPIKPFLDPPIEYSSQGSVMSQETREHNR